MIWQLNWKRLCFYSLCVLFAGLTFSTALAETMIFVALVFWLVWKFQQGRPSFGRGWDTGFILLAAFTIFCALTFLWSEFPKQSGKGILKVFEHFMLMWIARDIFFERKEKKDFGTVLLWIFTVIMLDSAFQWWTGKDFIRGFSGVPASSGFRLMASFKGYGIYASFLVMTLPYVIASAVERRKYSKRDILTVATGLLAVSGAVCLFLTRSRGGLLSFTGSGFVLLILRREWKRMVLLLGVLLLLISLLPKGMVIHLDAENQEQSLVERYYLWDRAVQVIRATPFGGTGINTYAAAHARYDKTKNWRVRNYYAHNGYLQTAAETGLTGLGLFLAGLWFFFAGVLKGLKSKENDPDGRCLWGILTGLFGFLILVFVDTVLHNNESVILFWFFMGLCKAYADSMAMSAEDVS